MSGSSGGQEGVQRDGLVLAAVDIGTNTLKFSVARCYPDGRIEPLDERNDTVRLGAGIERTGGIDPERLDRAVRTLVTFEQAGRDQGARRFVGVATEALRVASNGQEFLDRVRRETAWEIRTISGDEEARLTFLGLRSWLPADGPGAIVDIGGGSTEVVATIGGDIESASSVPIGSGRVADRWFRADPPGREALRNAEQDARAFLESRASVLDGRGGVLLLSGGNGQFIDMLRAHFALGAALDEQVIRLVLERLADEPADSVATVLGIQRERAAVLPAGVAIAVAVASAVRPDRVVAVPSGIRTGLLRDVIERDGFASLR